MRRLCPSGVEARLRSGSVHLVADVQAARRAIRLPDGVAREGRDARGRWLRVPPERAHGIRLELLQPDDRGLR